MAWRLARSLVTLRNEINLYAPNRSKLSDGTIGDPDHQTRCSRHNPNNSGVVCAFDCTHDPASGLDIHRFARLVAASPFRHPELEYITSDRQICSRADNWVWRTYTDANPHTLHAHFAVGRGSDCEPTSPYDSLESWHVHDFLSPSTESSDLMDPFYYVINNFAYYSMDPYSGKVHGVSGAEKEDIDARGKSFRGKSEAELDAMLAKSHQTRNGWDISA
jgi:hypothetical protein